MTTASTRVVTVVLPGQLRELTGGEAQIVIEGAGGTVAALFLALRERHRSVYDRIFTEQGEVRPHVNVFVDGADIRWAGGLEATVGPSSEVLVLPAVSGG
ncbi:MAG: molybdopterin synthase sulfur carrier subunit [Gemmatimonadetes bacterium]|nr:molybdopterin synthase sulfur carrier subunit [Gemmatimonadota bacterium]